MLGRHLTYANVTATIAVVLAAGGGAFAVAQSGGGTTSNTITACVKRSGPKAGTARFVNRCRSNERRVTWSRQGPQGVAGTSGTPGAPGVTGAPGAPGTSGPPGAPNPDATLLDGLDSTDFLRSNANAGGDLGGPFAALQIGEEAVGTDEIEDDSIGTNDVAPNALSGQDIDETSFDDLNAGSTDFVSFEVIDASVPSGQASNSGYSMGDLGLNAGCSSNDVHVSLTTAVDNTSLVATDVDSNTADADWDTGDGAKDLETDLGVAEGNQVQITYRSGNDEVITIQLVTFDAGLPTGIGCRAFGIVVFSET